MSTVVRPDNELLRDKLKITESPKEERKRRKKGGGTRLNGRRQDHKGDAGLILLATWMGSCDLQLGAFRYVCLLQGAGTTKWPPDV